MEIQEDTYMDCDDESIEELYFGSNLLSVYSKKLFYWIFSVLTWFFGAFSKNVKAILLSKSGNIGENSTSGQYDNSSSRSEVNGSDKAPSGHSGSIKKDKQADSTEHRKANQSYSYSLVGQKPHEKKKKKTQVTHSLIILVNLIIIHPICLFLLKLK